ncbi:LssY C-terminal domain-containing protein [Desulfobacterota bacterium AH_259_B03_O07]|nr:LssY C-terminal domain-containing protein [Desulfobacterota bacterium AH_259_B03_O07]
MTPRTIVRQFTIIIVILSLFGCAKRSSTPYSPRPVEEVPFLERAQTQSRHGLTVTASVLSPAESHEVFGVDLANKGVQPVWVKVENESDSFFTFLPISIDPEYYSPGEIAFMFKGNFIKPDYIKMDEYLEELAMGIGVIPSGEERSGFVYTDMDPGVKQVNVALYTLHQLEDFDFFFKVPGVTADAVDFDSLYSEKEIVNYDNEEELRAALESLPRCITNKDGTGKGDPINFVFIGNREDIGDALIRRKWDVAETVSESNRIKRKEFFSTGRYRTMPLSDYYLYGRPQDVGLQKARRTKRGNLRQRIQMRLWLSPTRFKAEEVWVGAISTDTGSKIKWEGLTVIEAHQIDPDIDEARDYLVEDIVFSRNVSKLGKVKGIEPATRYKPHVNLLDQPWWTDGYRVVFLFQEEPVTLTELEFFPWEVDENREFEN